MIKYILIAVLLIGCGSRKVKVTETKKDSISKSVEVVNEVKNKTEENKTTFSIFSEDNEIIFKPIDEGKEMFINGVIYKNTVLSVRNNKTNTLYHNDKKVSENEAKQQIKANETKVITKEKTKQIDKKINYWYLLILIPIFYYIYKRSKILKFS